MWTPMDERFQTPTEPRVAAKCVWCSGEIYVGDTFTLYSNEDMTHDGDCENAYVAAELGIERLIAE
jgi:hypothetical protein